MKANRTLALILANDSFSPASRIILIESTKGRLDCSAINKRFSPASRIILIESLEYYMLSVSSETASFSPASRIILIEREPPNHEMLEYRVSFSPASRIILIESCFSTGRLIKIVRELFQSRKQDYFN